MKTTTVPVLVLAFTMTAATQEVYSTWAQHKYVVLDTRAGALNVPAPVLGIPVLVRLDSVNFNTGFAQSVGRGADIRFTRNGDAVRLPHQIDRWDSTGKRAEIWVRVDTVRGNNYTSFRMHWGKAGAADSSRGAAVFDTADGFQAVLHLGEATDSLARDATLNGFHATPANAGSSNPFDTVGVIGRAKSLRRVSSTASSYFTLAGTASGKLNFPEGSAFTLSAWASYYYANSSHVISKDERQYSLARRTSGTQWEVKQMVEGEGKQYIQSEPGLTNAWQYVVGVRNGGQMALYVDGVLAGDGISVDGSATDRYTAGDVQIGRCPDQGTVATGTAASVCNYLPGAVDEVVISSRARSAGWIKLSYETQKPTARSVLTDTMPVPLPISSRPLFPASGFSARMAGGGIAFRLPEASAPGRLSVADVWGRTVWARNVGSASGSEIFWDGRSARGTMAPSGVYLVRFAPPYPAPALETKVMLTR